MKKLMVILIIPIILIVGVLIYKFSFFNKPTKNNSLINNFQEKLNSEIIYKENLDGDKKENLINKINNSNSIGEFNSSKTYDSGNLNTGKKISEDINKGKKTANKVNNTLKNNNTLSNNNSLSNNNLIDNIIDKIIGHHHLIKIPNKNLSLEIKKEEIKNLQNIKIFMREKFNGNNIWELGEVKRGSAGPTVRKYIVQPKKIYNDGLNKIYYGNGVNAVVPKIIVDIQGNNSNSKIDSNKDKDLKINPSINKNNIIDNNIDSNGKKNSENNKINENDKINGNNKINENGEIKGDNAINGNNKKNENNEINSDNKINEINHKNIDSLKNDKEKINNNVNPKKEIHRNKDNSKKDK